MKISIVTLVRGRQAALLNTLKGIHLSNRQPDEVLIVHMNEAVYPLPDLGLNIRQEAIRSDHQLPLAAARNKAMKMASYDHVIFLDVDCIPDRELISRYEQAFVSSDSLLSGKVSYLPYEALEKTDLFDQLKAYSLPNPVRANLQHYPYELFWSLNFACSKQIFEQIGGFDETFCGYGAEDTDFSFSARKNRVGLITVDANAYHQAHPSYDPPLNHLQDIVANARRFKNKWDLWPMTGWLKKFSDSGYIKMDGETITLLKLPDAKEIESVRKQH